MIKTIVTWKNPSFRNRYIIGELIYDHKIYNFRYCGEFEEAIKVGFKGIGEFKDLKKEYESSELFLTFSSRIPDRKRNDFKNFLKEHQILESANDLEILLSTRGFLITDTIEVFPKIDFQKNKIGCFLVGTRHYLKETTYLDKNMKIKLVLEPDNKHDEFAIYVSNEKKEKLGYIPKIYSKEMTKWLKESSYSVKIEKLLRLDAGRRIEIYILIEKNFKNIPVGNI